jgi:hypothetical protein
VGKLLNASRMRSFCAMGNLPSGDQQAVCRGKHWI